MFSWNVSTLMFLALLLQEPMSIPPNGHDNLRMIEVAGGRVLRDSAGNAVCVILISKLPIYTPFRDEDIEAIDFSALVHVTSVTLVSRKVTDKSLDRIGAIPSRLDVLVLAGGMFSDNAVSQLLRRQPFLTRLDLCDCPIRDVTLVEIGKLKKLNTLMLSNTKVSAQGIKKLSGLSGLRFLNLSRCHVGDEAVSEILTMSDLRLLDVSGTKVTDDGILKLKTLENLERLIVTNTKVTEAGKKALQEHLPNLQFTK